MNRIALALAAGAAVAASSLTTSAANAYDTAALVESNPTISADVSRPLDGECLVDWQWSNDAADKQVSTWDIRFSWVPLQDGEGNVTTAPEWYRFVEGDVVHAGQTRYLDVAAKFTDGTTSQSVYAANCPGPAKFKRK